MIARKGRFFSRLLVLFTSTPEQMHHYWLGHYFPQMMAKAAAQMPNLGTLKAAAQASGLILSAMEPFWVTNKLQDFFLYSGKYQPALYLSPRIRQGISAFCNLCETDELERGLAQLRLDIESHQINQHLAAIDNRLGDYSFVTFEKIL